MKAEDTLQFMADFDAELFPTRKHALNHLFCVIGNGYEWVNGELVDREDIYSKRYKLRKAVKKAEFQQEKYWTQMSQLYNIMDHQNSICGKIVVTNKYNFQWYPLSRSSYLYTIPDNIKPDWLQVRDECVSLLKAEQLLLENVPIPKYKERRLLTINEML